MRSYTKVEDLLGKTLHSVSLDGNDRIIFVTADGDKYLMYHSQDCCESVVCDDIAGDLRDLIGQPLLVAEEVSSEPPPRGEDEYVPESETWTFYKFATIQGSVTIRWHGESNGYYSESVSFERQ